MVPAEMALGEDMNLELEEVPTPLVDVLFANTEERRVNQWIRRFARDLQEDVVGDGDDLAGVKRLLERTLGATCTSDWEMKNLESVKKNSKNVVRAATELFVPAMTRATFEPTALRRPIRELAPTEAVLVRTYSPIISQASRPQPHTR